MNYAQRRDGFLSEFAADAPERPFYESAFKVMEALSPSITYENSLACIKVLHFAIITLASGYTLGDDPAFMGSIEDCSHVIATMFAEINPDPIWWKASFAADMTRQEVSMAAKAFVQKLKSLDFIARIE